MSQTFILTLSCPDRVGLVAGLARLMEQHGCFIVNSRTFGDPETNRFFARLVFTPPGNGGSLDAVKEAMAPLAAEIEADWQIRSSEEKLRTLLMVSKSDHCANTLLYAARRNELPIEITGIVSNHDTLKPTFAHWGLPWFHVPVSAATKPAAESRLDEIIAETRSELVVLARYMQVLSEDACRRHEGRVINIHHSFLPGFKGAQPYHQAHARGVKVIGATAHYVTADLDEGPIISQATEAIDHTFTPEDMVETGRHIEGIALLRAVKAHAEHRIFLNSGRTVVFAR
ncbi:formyltetrahydrofolate deformylase [Hyphomonas sp. WL0036]|uniref:formyltetrahydrofolate deformylase n=1 Tax=Hyphomonas sediminis TaxID=2866160 RepID=UPI001C7F0FE5|nr:formyltetrahydrofolate deformylase [Hyphomonas sediminis]MBY9068560.1 formyltetrahydrofolate deformylase [Hyphomonas sediminis]